ncbi:hypothetical protein PPYR_14712 [Photinus pyralis]|uniref:G-protein coupled receptors family 1 profile domain-containing protein n=1 Tax=Photinus pyralis TaxID=7054 RepID=A0A5N4A606_PHOPY|nr:pyrokinin-1 receptor-like [Photinus pyralis]KAB0792753.1 hypothetical protein PPYR_14712 [Photinus pyralis]
MEETTLIESATENYTQLDYNNSSEFIRKLYGPKRDSLNVVIPITIIYVIIFVTGLIGNISTCVVISRNKSMHTATNYYLFSLAISDLLLLVSGLPQEVYCIWSRYPYVFGQVFCVLRGLFSETSANATVLTITAFTVERYIAICHPFLSHTMSKLSRAVKFILIIWLVSIVFAVPQALQFEVVSINGIPESTKCDAVRTIIPHSFEFSTFVFFIGPMSLITILYVLIGMRLRSSNKMKKVQWDFRRRNDATTAASKRSESVKQRQIQTSRRVLKMLVAVVVTFFLCWAPFHTQRLVAIYGTIPADHEDRQLFFRIYEIVTYTSGVLYYFSTTVNPLLYNIMSNKFREAFKETFAACCRIRFMSPEHPKCSYAVLSRSIKRGQDSCTDSSGKDDASIQTNVTSSFRIPSDAVNTQRIGLRSCFTTIDSSGKFTSFGKLDRGERFQGLRITTSTNTHMLTFQPTTSEFTACQPIETINGINYLSSSSCDISNSSLKDVENVLLEYELSDYLCLDKQNK